MQRCSVGQISAERIPENTTGKHFVTSGELEGDLISFMPGNSEIQHFNLNYAVELIYGGGEKEFLIKFLRELVLFSLMRSITVGCSGWSEPGRRVRVFAAPPN